VGRYHVPLSEGTQDHPIALYTVGLGGDGRLLEAVGLLGYEGLVIEALGGGHVLIYMAEPLQTLAGEMPVVLASRTGSGEVLRNTYGFTGSETDLLERGLINAGMLDGPKARLFLSLLLRSGTGKQEIAGAFDRLLGA
jgi:L-asparaginase